MTQVAKMSPKKILVVEDNETLGRFLLHLLQLKGYAAELAPDGEVGMERYLHNRPDLVLTDVYMPNSEGIGLITQIRACDQTTPIIVMSGGDPKQDHRYLHAATALGANASLNKPFTADDLLNIIRHLLGEQ